MLFRYTGWDLVLYPTHHSLSVYEWLRYIFAIRPKISLVLSLTLKLDKKPFLFMAESYGRRGHPGKGTQRPCFLTRERLFHVPPSTIIWLLFLLRLTFVCMLNVMRVSQNNEKHQCYGENLIHQAHGVIMGWADLHRLSDLIPALLNITPQPKLRNLIFHDCYSVTQGASNGFHGPRTFSSSIRWWRDLPSGSGPCGSKSCEGIDVAWIRAPMWSYLRTRRRMGRS